jgi:hypothetical protein
MATNWSPICWFFVVGFQDAKHYLGTLFNVRYCVTHTEDVAQHQCEAQPRTYRTRITIFRIISRKLFMVEDETRL